jgi:N-carbamoyl-L-amino-acid hydrolase
VAFFTDEEGSRFAPDMLGSLVYVGGMPLEEALDLRAIDGPGSATSWSASATPGRCPAPA